MIQKLLDNEFQRGLLAFSPFFLAISSLFIGFSTGLITVILFLLLAPLIYSLRNLIPSQQRLAFILVISVSFMLIARMLLQAEAYSIADKIGLFLPLLLMNSMVLSVNETMFSMQDIKSAISHIFISALAILFFFVIFGFMRELVDSFSIFTSPAGCFFLSAFIFAAINFFKS
jgi:H+/Na+-translocating ferredoxin:NAD+ oxidoreductase subunit E